MKRMKSTGTDRRRRSLRELFREQRGAVMVFVAFGMVVIFGFTGLAIDTGRAFNHRAQLSRAVDAGVLAAARTLRAGQTVATQEAEALAEANGVKDGLEGASVNLVFGTNEFGERTISMEATRPMNTLFMGLFGHHQIDVVSSAVAAVPPVDMVLVLDQSGSLGNANAFDDLQLAAKNFVQHFDDNIDQLGLISFQVRATERTPLDFNFTSNIESAIDNMNSAGDTNAQEGLRLAYQQLQGANVRERSAKVVVFFTDGRPTALRGNISSPMGGTADRMLAVYTGHANGQMRGYFNDPDNLPTDVTATPHPECRNETSCGIWTEPTIREATRDSATVRANTIRADGIFLYTIALGNPSEPDPIKVPDLDWLKFIANEDGIADPDQRQGRSYFAPSPAELQDVFNQVAQDLLVRLAQ